MALDFPVFRPRKVLRLQSLCHARALLVGAAVFAGCIGRVEDTPPRPVDLSPAGGADAPVGGSPGVPMGDSAPGSADTLARCASAPEVGASMLRRLSRSELALTLQDLFQLPAPPSVEAVPADNETEGFTTFVEVQTVSAQHLRSYASLARELADALLADPARQRAVVGCPLTGAGCLTQFAKSFGRLAYRRPLEAQELSDLTSRAVTHALDGTDQFRYLIQALLISPSFLYRVEIGDKPDGLSTLTSAELATRLSFTLWGRGPNAQLLDEAEAGKLNTPPGLREVAKRMLSDARTQQFFEGFFRQWLGYAQLRAPNTKPNGWTDSLLSDMQKETDSALAEHAFGTGSLLDALTSNQTTVSAPLAALYGFPVPAADGHLTIPSSHPRARAGILGHASLLSLKSDGDMVALRGNWLRRTFFCRTLSIPPDVADELGDLLVGLTRVEVVQKRNREAACKGCHGRIDPIGVGLAAFDATGLWDPKADPSVYGIKPALPDLEPAAFDSLSSLATKLRAAPEVAACLTEKVFSYVGGRKPVTSDACALDAASTSFEASGQGFRSLLAGVVEADAFRLRRAPAPSLAAAAENDR